VFVTGNANKLKEVREILSSGGHPIEIESQSLDRTYLSPRKIITVDRVIQFPKSKGRQKKSPEINVVELLNWYCGST